MKNDYIVRAQNFINVFFKDFILPSERKVGYCFKYTQNFNSTHKRSVIFTYGYTRLVFITSDYVIKINYFESNFGLCEDEVMVYNQAKKDNMDYLFAKITPYEFNGNIYYIMPRINGIDEDSERVVEDYLTNDEYNYVFNYLGLHDLHCGNFGFKNGEVILVDYACCR